MLQITGHPQCSAPFGQDRLVPIFLVTLAVQQKSQTVRFRTAAEMLEGFGMHTGGKEYRGLVAAFERVFGATIFSGTDTDTTRFKRIQRSRLNFMNEAHIWHSRAADYAVLSSEFENIVALSDEFYKKVSSHPLPNDLEAVKVLAGSPAVLDLYMWLTYRCFKATGTETIPIFGEYDLVAQFGTVEYSRPRRFRSMLEQWLRTIRVIWPECPAQIASSDEQLIVRHADAVRQLLRAPEPRP